MFKGVKDIILFLIDVDFIVLIVKMKYKERFIIQCFNLDQVNDDFKSRE